MKRVAIFPIPKSFLQLLNSKSSLPRRKMGKKHKKILRFDVRTLNRGGILDCMHDGNLFDGVKLVYIHSFHHIMVRVSCKLLLFTNKVSVLLLLCLQKKGIGRFGSHMTHHVSANRGKLIEAGVLLSHRQQI